MDESASFDGRVPCPALRPCQSHIHCRALLHSCCFKKVPTAAFLHRCVEQLLEATEMPLKHPLSVVEDIIQDVNTLLVDIGGVF